MFRTIRDLESCFAGAARALRNDRPFGFDTPYPSYGLFDPEPDELDRSYFEPEPEPTSIDDLDPEMVVFHHRIGELNRTFVEAEVTADRLFEPDSDDPGDYEERWSPEPELTGRVPPTLAVV